MRPPMSIRLLPVLVLATGLIACRVDDPTPTDPTPTPASVATAGMQVHDAFDGSAADSGPARRDGTPTGGVTRRTASV